MYCSKCGNQLNHNERFCSACGTPVTPAVQPVQNNQPINPRPAVPAQPVDPNAPLIYTDAVWTLQGVGSQRGILVVKWEGLYFYGGSNPEQKARNGQASIFIDTRTVVESRMTGGMRGPVIQIVMNDGKGIIIQNLSRIGRIHTAIITALKAANPQNANNYR